MTTIARHISLHVLFLPERLGAGVVHDRVLFSLRYIRADFTPPDSQFDKLTPAQLAVPLETPSPRFAHRGAINLTAIKTKAKPNLGLQAET